MNLVSGAGILAFALSGALVGRQKSFDIVGVCALAIVTALGGGIARDLLTNHQPPAAMTDSSMLLVAMAAVPISFISPRLIRLGMVPMKVVDALGLGIFAAGGAAQAGLAGLSPVASLVVAVIAGAGGGVIRDVLAGDPPLLFTQEIYALAAAGGALLVVICASLHVQRLTGQGLQVAGAAVTFGLRILAIRFGWHLGASPRREPGESAARKL
ncbi:MAG: trimeric intracellular cation channel family protein [Candidatus Dormibacteria bacterium]